MRRLARGALIVVAILVGLVGLPLLAVVEAPAVLRLVGRSEPPQLRVWLNGNEMAGDRDHVDLPGRVAMISGEVHEPPDRKAAVQRRSSSFSIRLSIDGVLKEEVTVRRGSFAFSPVFLSSPNSRLSVQAKHEGMWWRGAAQREFSVFSGRHHQSELEIRTRTTSTSLTSVPVHGWTAPASPVTILVNGEAAASVFADQEGRFVAVVPLKAVGDNAIVAETGGGASTSNVLKVVYRPQPARLLSRALRIEVKASSTVLQFEAELPADEPLADLLIGRSASPGAFFDAAAGRLRFDDSSYRGLFADATTRLEVGDGRLKVSLSSEIGPLAPASGRWRIGRSGGADVPRSADRLELVLKAHKLVGFAPVPRSAGERTIVWADGEAAAGVTVELRKDHATTPSLIRLRASDVLPPVAMAFVYRVLVALPMLWFLAVSRGPLARSWTTAELEPLRQSSIVLAGICLVGAVPPLFYAAYDALHAAIGDDSLDGLVDFLDRNLAFPAGSEAIGAGLCLVGLAALWLLAWPLPKGVRPFSRDALKIVSFAMLVALGITTANLVLDRLLPQRLSFAVALAFGVAIVVGFLSYVKSCLGRVCGGKIRVEAWVAAIVVVAVACALFRREPGEDHYWLVSYAASFGLVSSLSVVTPLCFALLLAASMLKHPTVGLDPGKLRLAGAMVFASLLVSTSPTWFVVPVQVVLAYLIARHLLFLSDQQLERLEILRQDILEHRGLLLQRAVDHAKSMTVRRRRILPDRKSGAGDTRAGDDGDGQGSQGVLFVTTPDGERLRATELALAFGVGGNPVSDARDALRAGAWFGLGIATLYLIPFLFAPPNVWDSFPLLSAAIQFLIVSGRWLVAAFFFGYWYTAIRGRAGWEKGVWVAASLTVAEAPLALLQADSASDYAAVLLTTALRFAFFIAVGLLAFDQRIFRETLRRSIDWRAFSRASGLSVTGAFGSAVVAAVGVAASSALTGQLSSVLTFAAKTLLPFVPVGTQAASGG